MLNENVNDITTYKIYNYDDKKKIVYKIQQIKNKKYYFELYKLVANNNIQFTKNNNGVFFNINKLSNKALQEIDDFLDLNCDDSIQDSDISTYDSESIYSIEEQIPSPVILKKINNQINIKRKILIE